MENPTNQPGKDPFHLFSLSSYSAHAVSTATASRGHPSLVSLVYTLQFMIVPVILKIFCLIGSLICNWRIFYLLSLSSKASTSFPPTFLSLYVYSSPPLFHARPLFHIRCPLPRPLSYPLPPPSILRSIKMIVFRFF
jgi:hypothetical protein